MSANNNNLDQNQDSSSSSSPIATSDVCGGHSTQHQLRSVQSPPQQLQQQQQQQQPRNAFSTGNNTESTNLNKIKNQQSLIDLIVAMIAIPTLVLLALTLETKMREDWMEKLETRWTVLGVGIGLLCASLLTCGYVTHRMGVCLWAGPQEDDTFPANLTRLNTEVDIEQIIESLPPSYETVMGSYEAPPPYSNCVFVDIGDIKEINKEPLTEITASSHHT